MSNLPIRIAVRIDFADGSQHEHEVRTSDAVPALQGFFPEGVVTADVSARMTQHAEMEALIGGWQQEIAENRQEENDSFGVSDDEAGYHRGYADALDRCVQALRLLVRG